MSIPSIGVASSLLKLRLDPRRQDPAAVVYGNTEGPELRVITCGGSFDSATGHYRDNTVLFARLAS